MDEFGKKKKGFSLGDTDKERRNNLIIIMLVGRVADRCGIIFFVQHSENKKMMQALKYGESFDSD
jgi:hypothetical protein